MVVTVVLTHDNHVISNSLVLNPSLTPVFSYLKNIHYGDFRVDKHIHKLIFSFLDNV